LICLLFNIATDGKALNSGKENGCQNPQQVKESLLNQKRPAFDHGLMG